MCLGQMHKSIQIHIFPSAVSQPHPASERDEATPSGQGAAASPSQYRVHITSNKHYKQSISFDMHISHCRIHIWIADPSLLTGMYELLRVRSRWRLQRLWNQFVQATISPFSGGATWSDNVRKGMTNFRHTGYTWYTFWLPLKRAKEQTLQTCWPLWFGNWQMYQAAGASGTLGHASTVHNVHLQSASSFGAKIWSYRILHLISDIDPTNLVKSDETQCVPVTL